MADPVLLAFAGLSGVGKTTAVEYLSKLGLGQSIYLGDFVLNEVTRLGLMPGPQSESTVRLALREQRGPAVLADLAMSAIQRTLVAGRNVFIDAIFEPAEYESIAASCGHCPRYLIGIRAGFEIRLARLLARGTRPYSREQLLERDQLENTRLRTGSVLAAADQTLANDDTLSAFHATLDGIARSLLE